MTDTQNEHDEPIMLQEKDKAVVSTAALPELPCNLSLTCRGLPSFSMRWLRNFNMQRDTG
jgi:hypothetical protein